MFEIKAKEYSSHALIRHKNMEFADDMEHTLQSVNRHNTLSNSEEERKHKIERDGYLSNSHADPVEITASTSSSSLSSASCKYTQELTSSSATLYRPVFVIFTPQRPRPLSGLDICYLSNTNSTNCAHRNNRNKSRDCYHEGNYRVSTGSNNDDNGDNLNKNTILHDKKNFTTKNIKHWPSQLGNTNFHHNSGNSNCNNNIDNNKINRYISKREMLTHSLVRHVHVEFDPLTHSEILCIPAQTSVRFLQPTCNVNKNCRDCHTEPIITYLTQLHFTRHTFHTQRPTTFSSLPSQSIYTDRWHHLLPSCILIIQLQLKKLNHSLQSIWPVSFASEAREPHLESSMEHIQVRRDNHNNCLGNNDTISQSSLTPTITITITLRDMKKTYRFVASNKVVQLHISPHEIKFPLPQCNMTSHWCNVIFDFPQLQEWIMLIHERNGKSNKRQFISEKFEEQFVELYAKAEHVEERNKSRSRPASEMRNREVHSKQNSLESIPPLFYLSNHFSVEQICVNITHGTCYIRRVVAVKADMSLRCNESSALPASCHKHTADAKQSSSLNTSEKCCPIAETLPSYFSAKKVSSLIPESLHLPTEVGVVQTIVVGAHHEWAKEEEEKEEEQQQYYYKPRRTAKQDIENYGSTKAEIAPCEEHNIQNKKMHESSEQLATCLHSHLGPRSLDEHNVGISERNRINASSNNSSVSNDSIFTIHSPIKYHSCAEVATTLSMHHRRDKRETCKFNANEEHMNTSNTLLLVPRHEEVVTLTSLTNKDHRQYAKNANLQQEQQQEHIEYSTPQIKNENSKHYAERLPSEDHSYSTRVIELMTKLRNRISRIDEVVNQDTFIAKTYNGVNNTIEHNKQLENEWGNAHDTTREAHLEEEVNSSPIEHLNVASTLSSNKTKEKENSEVFTSFSPSARIHETLSSNTFVEHSINEENVIIGEDKNSDSDSNSCKVTHLATTTNTTPTPLVKECTQNLVQEVCEQKTNRSSTNKPEQRDRSVSDEDDDDNNSKKGLRELEEKEPPEKEEEEEEEQQYKVYELRSKCDVITTWVRDVAKEIPLVQSMCSCASDTIKDKDYENSSQARQRGCLEERVTAVTKTSNSNNNNSTVATAVDRDANNKSISINSNSSSEHTSPTFTVHTMELCTDTPMNIPEHHQATRRPVRRELTYSVASVNALCGVPKPSICKTYDNNNTVEVNGTNVNSRLLQHVFTYLNDDENINKTNSNDKTCKVETRFTSVLPTDQQTNIFTATRTDGLVQSQDKQENNTVANISTTNEQERGDLVIKALSKRNDIHDKLPNPLQRSSFQFSNWLRLRREHEANGEQAFYNGVVHHDEVELYKQNHIHTIKARHKHKVTPSESDSVQLLTNFSTPSVTNESNDNTSIHNVVTNQNCLFPETHEQLEEPQQQHERANRTNCTSVVMTNKTHNMDNNSKVIIAARKVSTGCSFPSTSALHALKMTSEGKTSEHNAKEECELSTSSALDNSAQVKQGLHHSSMTVSEIDTFHDKESCENELKLTHSWEQQQQQQQQEHDTEQIIDLEKSQKFIVARRKSQSILADHTLKSNVNNVDVDNTITHNNANSVNDSNSTSNVVNALELNQNTLAQKEVMPTFTITSTRSNAHTHAAQASLHNWQPTFQIPLHLMHSALNQVASRYANMSTPSSCAPSRYTTTTTTTTNATAKSTPDYSMRNTNTLCNECEEKSKSKTTPALLSLSERTREAHIVQHNVSTPETFANYIHRESEGHVNENKRNHMEHKFELSNSWEQQNLKENHIDNMLWGKKYLHTDTSEIDSAANLFAFHYPVPRLYSESTTYDESNSSVSSEDVTENRDKGYINT